MALGSGTTSLAETDAAIDLWRSFRGARGAQIGAGIVAVIALLAFAGPLVAPQNPYDLAQLNLLDAFKPPAFMAGGEAGHLLGTDEQGRDLFSAMLYGARTSIFVGLVGVLFAAGIGTFLGLLSGYAGGIIDSIIMRIGDVELSLPSILIALFIMYFSEPGILNIIIAITAVEWVLYARTARASTIAEREKGYVEAARSIGVPGLRIVFRHLLPNILAPIVVIANVRFAWVIILEASLSFLGAGVPPEQPSLGRLILNGYQMLFSGYWWISALPGLALVLLVLGVNLLGDWLREAMNPKLAR
jgi:peptide/nickel transport system permease protein